MAPNLAASQHELVQGMIEEGSTTDTQIAKTVGCSTRCIRAIRANLRCFGSSKAPRTTVGRTRSITPPMLDALRNRLLTKPDMYQHEMARFLQSEFDMIVTKMSISRALASVGWSKKTTRNIAKERNADLRDSYSYALSDFRSYHLVYIDKSACDRRVGVRRTGWAPLGVTPAQVSRFHRDERYQILPAYAQDGIMLSRVFKGSTDSDVIEEFIQELLPLCGRWPEPKSVLIMDNAGFHQPEKLRQLCNDAGVKLLFLPPYSPDLNPIEEFFSEVKAFIKRNWHLYDGQQDFGHFLEWCVHVVGSRKASAEGHFWHAGVSIKVPENNEE